MSTGCSVVGRTTRGAALPMKSKNGAQRAPHDSRNLLAARCRVQAQPRHFSQPHGGASIRGYIHTWRGTCDIAPPWRRQIGGGRHHRAFSDWRYPLEVPSRLALTFAIHAQHSTGFFLATASKQAQSCAHDIRQGNCLRQRTSSIRLSATATDRRAFVFSTLTPIRKPIPEPVERSRHHEATLPWRKIFVSVPRVGFYSEEEELADHSASQCPGHPKRVEAGGRAGRGKGTLVLYVRRRHEPAPMAWPFFFGPRRLCPACKTWWLTRRLRTDSLFTRSNFGEFMSMFSKTVAERTKPGQRQDVEENDHTFHCYGRSEGMYVACGSFLLIKNSGLTMGSVSEPLWPSPIRRTPHW